MLHKTEGIVLNFINYSETSVIVKIYTSKFGLQSYIVNGVRSKSGKGKIALYQPLTLLDMVVYYKENSGIQRISECRCVHPFYSIPFEPKKTCIAFFIAEVLGKTIKEEAGSDELFNFLHTSIRDLDTMPNDYENFHLLFLIQLSRHLGFGPSFISDILKPEVLKISSEEEKKFLTGLLNNENKKTTIDVRRSCLKHLLFFYSSHIEGFGEMNSVEVVKEILK